MKAKIQLVRDRNRGGPRNSIAIKAETVWNKVVWTLKIDKPNYFGGSMLPTEVTQEILCWIEPHHISKLRLLSRKINEAIVSSGFATLHVSHYVTKSYLPNSGNAIDQEWPRWPESHQHAFASSLFSNIIVGDKESPWIEGITKLIPAAIGSMEQLQILKLNGKKLHHLIPRQLGDLSNLTVLDLSENRLTGEIPTELGKLHRLQHLDLSSNLLSGRIPTDIGVLSLLKILNLSGNLLEGRIPVALTALTDLQELNLGSNRLYDAIPQQVGAMIGLKTLNLSSNKLVGNIPERFRRLVGLTVLNLSSNSLSGILPNLETMVQLKELDIRNNKFSGDIPTYFPRLEKLKVDSNELTGRIIVPWRLLGILKYLSARGNSFGGVFEDYDDFVRYGCVLELNTYDMPVHRRPRPPSYSWSDGYSGCS